METIVLAKRYLDKLSEIIQQEGTRDIYIIKARLKELNTIYKDDVIIFDTEKKYDKCIVYYGLSFDPLLVFHYEFKLGTMSKLKMMKYKLSLDKWEIAFNEEVRNKDISLEDIKKDISQWVLQYKDKNYSEVTQFLQTLKVYYKYTGQIIVSYKEFNGELKKIKPIIRLYSAVTLEELYLFAKEKSQTLWNRDFTCQIEIVKTFWKHQLGLYSPSNLTIYFSDYKNSKLSKNEIFDTMLHEMVHWHLHTSDKNYNDEDFDFIKECQRVGCSLSQDNKAQKAFFEYIKSQTIECP